MRVQAQNSIRNLLTNVSFEEVGYKQDGEAYLTGNIVPPSEIYVNEVNQTLVESGNSRALNLQVTSWTFKSKLTFQREVDASKAVEDFSDLPRFSVMDERTGQRKQTFRIRVSDIDYKHPPRRNATNGSVLNLTIEIEPISGR